MTIFNLPPLDDFNAWADFWRYKIGVNVIPAIGWTKKPIVKWEEWQTAPIPESLHNRWKSENKFNQGMAIITGKVWHRKDKQGYYLVAGDADNEVAMNEITNDLSKFAQNTLVEQNEDVPEKFHWLVYSIRPILNKDPDVKKDAIPLIEVKCLRRILYCTPCCNAKGIPKRIIGTPEANTLESYEKADEFEKLINDKCRKYNLKYLEKADKGKYAKNGATIELDDNKINEIVKTIKQYYLDGVRDLIIFSLSGFLYKLNVSLDSAIALTESLTDNDRKAITVTEGTYKKERSEVVGYTRLLDILEQSVGEDAAKGILTTIQNIVVTGNREGANQNKVCERKQALRQSLTMNIALGLDNDIWSMTSEKPMKFIIARRKRNNICRATVAKVETETTKDDGTVETSKSVQLNHGTEIFSVFPHKVTEKINPLKFLESPPSYTIEFETREDKRLTVEGSIEGILSQLSQKGYVSCAYGAKEALGKIIEAFRDDGEIILDESVDFEGYYYYNGDIHTSKVDFDKKHPVRTKEEVIKCIEYLEKRAKFQVWRYKGKVVDRQDVLASAIRWTVAAPFNFIIKQLNESKNPRYHKAFWFTGQYDGGKTGLTQEMLGMHGNSTVEDVESVYSVSAGEMDTSAKFGKGVAKTTYPIEISEYGRVENYGREEKMVETVKSAIDKLIVRKGRKEDKYDAPFPSCSPLIMNGNPYPSKRGDLLKRIHTVKHSEEDVHSRDPNTPFNKMQKEEGYLIKILGDWTIRYILDHKEEELLSRKYDGYQIGDWCIHKFFEFGDKKEVPEWLTRWITDTALEELNIDEETLIRSMLYENVNRSLHGEDLQTFEDRIKLCLDRRLWSWIRKLKVVDSQEEIYHIDSSILEIFNLRLPDLTLTRLGEKMGFKPVKDHKGRLVLRCSQTQLIKAIVGEVETEEIEIKIKEVDKR